jgi:cobalt/nickel transport system permease protein
MTHALGAFEREAKTLRPLGWGADICRLIDPRARILAACAFAVVVVALNDFLALGVALALAVGGMVAMKLPMARTLRRMAMMDGFIVATLLILPFTMPGEVAFTVLTFPASWEGISRAIGIALKANAVILMLMALVGSMEAVTLGHALSRLCTPMALVQLLLLTVRYIDVFREEYARLRTAMKTRGFRPANNRHTYRTFGYLIGMLLVRALERSERIVQAMKCRGFCGRFHVLDSLRLGREDAVFAVCFAVCLVGLTGIEMVHGRLI